MRNCCGGTVVKQRLAVVGRRRDASISMTAGGVDPALGDAAGALRSGRGRWPSQQEDAVTSGGRQMCVAMIVVTPLSAHE